MPLERTCAAAGVIEGLHEAHAKSRLGKLKRRTKTAKSSPDDSHIVLVLIHLFAPADKVRQGLGSSMLNRVSRRGDQSEDILASDARGFRTITQRCFGQRFLRSLKL